jgi:hypothetical protein
MRDGMGFPLARLPLKFLSPSGLHSLKLKSRDRTSNKKGWILMLHHAPSTDAAETPRNMGLKVDSAGENAANKVGDRAEVGFKSVGRHPRRSDGAGRE